MKMNCARPSHRINFFDLIAACSVAPLCVYIYGSISSGGVAVLSGHGSTYWSYGD